MDITLLYVQAGVTYSKTFEAMSLKGIDEPDRLRRNAVIHDYLTGTSEEQIDGFFKEPIEIEFKAGQDQISTRFLVSWYAASVKLFEYGYYVSQGTTDESLISDWLYECELGRAFTIKFWDEHKYYKFEDGIIPEADLYIKLKVVMDQDATQDSPESFTTNSGKLATMQNGDPWPSFNATTHDHYISILASDGSGAIFPATFSISSGDITITTFPAGSYLPDPANVLYANFSIAAVAK